MHFSEYLYILLFLAEHPLSVPYGMKDRAGNEDFLKGVFPNDKAGSVNILVCIKQNNDSSEFSRFDAHALEAALVIKERSTTPVRVDVATFAGKTGEKCIQRAYGVGADRGFHIIEAEMRYYSALEVATQLSQVAAETQYDLILTGVMSEDMMAGQTGPMLAQMLGRPCVTSVLHLKTAETSDWLTVERELEGGSIESLEIMLPCVLTIQAGTNTPRYPKLSQMLTARKKEIVSIPYIQSSTEYPNRQQVVGTEAVAQTRQAKRLQGTRGEKTAWLVAFLQQERFV